MKPSILSTSVLALTVAACPLAFAQQKPDAGQTLQQLNTRTPALPSQSSTPLFEKSATPTREKGGKKVVVSRVDVTGNSRISTAELLLALGDVGGKRYDMAEMKELADRISAYYHAKDYPFAKAYIPAQSLQNGVLQIAVVEGRYGQVKVEGTDSRAASAQAFLSRLNSGDVIEGRKLERTSLLLDDQPGYGFMPVIRPGATVGTGDLLVSMRPDDKVGGRLGMDNHGNRYTGRLRGTMDAYVNSPFMLGDRATLSTIYTQENMWYGNANYSASLGYSGLRGNVGYAHTYYELGKDFSSLDAHGTAKIASMGLTYPLVRSQQSNLNLSAGYQRKWLRDKQGSTSTDNRKSSDVVPVGMTFDHRDSLGGGGVTYGNVTWTHGVLDLDGSLTTTDRTTARTNGVFDKLNVDVARLQSTPISKLTVFGRVAGQVSRDNLDSSEDFGLGGADGVRGYPSGEGYGDEGFVAQLEARYAVTDTLTPYVFYDYGSLRTNHTTWTNGDNTRQIASTGAGIRASYKNLSADASAAWRTSGGSPESDSKDSIPQVWVKVGYTF